MKGKQLAVYISRTSVVATEVLRSSQEVLREAHIRFHEATPGGYKAELQQFFDQLEWGSDYSEFSLAWASNSQAVVPLSIYNDSHPKAIHQLLFGKNEDDATTDFNRLMELNLVIVYEIPDWVKSFFVKRFPHIEIKHENAFFLRATFQGSTFSKGLHFTVHDDYFSIALVERDELLFANTFAYQTVEDILYHLMYVLDQKNWRNASVRASSYFYTAEQRENAEAVIDLIQRHQLLKQMDFADPRQAIKLQPLCV
ncbi:MAG: DUF3822 family protein [Bacteroidota bacterium]